MEQEKFEQWCVVELFGHQKIAGFVTEAELGGKSFIRVDVPKVKDGAEEFTRFYGPGAIYCINPVTEHIAREAAKRIDSRPVVAWDIGIDPQRQIPFNDYESNSDFEDNDNILY